MQAQQQTHTEGHGQTDIDCPVDIDYNQVDKKVVLSRTPPKGAVDSYIKAFSNIIENASPDQVKAGKYYKYYAVKFTPNDHKTQLRFYDVYMIRKHYGSIFKQLYFVRDAHQNDSYVVATGLYLYAPRKGYGAFMRQLIHGICGNEDVVIRKAVHGKGSTGRGKGFAPLMRKTAGYKKENMFVMMNDDLQDIEEADYMKKLDINVLVEKVKREYSQLVSTICLAPHGYNTILRDLQTMSLDELKRFFKTRDIESVYHDFQGIVYDAAICSMIKKTDSGTVDIRRYFQENNAGAHQVISDECLKLKIFSELKEKTYAQFIQCAIGRDGFPVEHPSLYYSIRKNLSILFRTPLIDLTIYNPDFMLSIMLIGRQFARVCMQCKDNVSSNRATTLLCGAAGAGKSLITNMFEIFCSGYRWNPESIYQSPNVLHSSMIIIEEVRLETLHSPQAKQLLDYTSTVKTEIKNSHPMDISKHCPVIMNTNESVDDFLSHNRSSRGHSKYTEQQIEAIKRRLAIIPFADKFTTLHQLDSLAKQTTYGQLYKEFCDMEKTKPALFNFILTFGLYQTHLTNFEVDEELRTYFHSMINQFDMTVFGRMYITNKNEIDAILELIEEASTRAIYDERTVEKVFYKASSQLGQLMEAMYTEIVNSSQNKEQLRNVLKHSQWTEGSTFMKRILLLNDPVFKGNIFNQYSQSFISPQWQQIIKSDDFRLNSDSDDDLPDKDQSDGAVLE